MKKIICIIIFIGLLIGGYFTYKKLTEEKVKKLIPEETAINVDKIYMYGPHLNIEGSNLPAEELSLILYNGEFINIPIIKKDDNTFVTANYVNEGLFLDTLENGVYYLFLENKEIINDKETKKYYTLNNITNYKETVY